LFAIEQKIGQLRASMSAKLERQLAKAYEDLAMLKTEYEEFIYIVSHDLSAPLRQIEGFADIIASKHVDSFDDKTKRHFELITDGSNKVKELLDAIKRYSRINTAVQSFTLVDLNKLTAVVKENLSTLINEKEALITVEHLPSVVGDLKQITLVFECLIHNSLTYQALDNIPKINLSVVDSGADWTFCLNDNGIGVAKGLTEKIFKVLRRGVPDKKYAGMGMGLAVAKKILQKHQGHIWLGSEDESGASFYFTIAKDLPYG
jgi:light-regulated signal transduction histidine kinase (bacteriophytochrome)